AGASGVAPRALELLASVTGNGVTDPGAPPAGTPAPARSRRPRDGRTRRSPAGPRPASAGEGPKPPAKSATPGEGAKTGTPHEAAPADAAPARSIRVSAPKVDRLLDAVGETVL